MGDTTWYAQARARQRSLSAAAIRASVALANQSLEDAVGPMGELITTGLTALRDIPSDAALSNSAQNEVGILMDNIRETIDTDIIATLATANDRITTQINLANSRGANTMARRLDIIDEVRADVEGRINNLVDQYNEVASQAARILSLPGPSISAEGVQAILDRHLTPGGTGATQLADMVTFEYA